MTMHKDAVADSDTPEKLLELVQQLFEAKRNWGAVFTNYDVLCAFNMEAVRNVGQWDTVLPQYFADNDYYRRMAIKGYEIIESGLNVQHQNGGSNTIRGDDSMKTNNNRTFKLYAYYYASKWGQVPGKELYTVPFQKESALFQPIY